MENRRKALDRLCPNRPQDLSNRLTKKQGRPERKQVHRKIFPVSVSGPVTIYTDPCHDAVDSALATIDWQDLADCTSVIERDSSNNAIAQQGHCLQTASEFDLQEFRDAVDSFISDQAPMMQPAMGELGFQLQHCHGTSFEPSTLHPSQDSLLHTSLQLPFAERYWRDVADQNEKALGDALVQNNQLHMTLTERQEEISTLKQRNTQLKELANQAKHLASVLDKLMLRRSTEEDVSASALAPRASVKRNLEELYDAGTQEDPEVDAILREISEKCSAALQTIEPSSDPKRFKPQMGASGETEGEAPGISLHGAFHGLQTCTGQRTLSMSGSALEEEGMCFRTSIRDHCTIRTLAFPQGNAFTFRTPAGGYKFRWVPS
ncbi:multicilin [Ambystoma mexicanum]|uniref:multicilin n=1 Tax=Ambystoma mexicanum TaxID=8296 RepID=UPI0037E74C3B